MGKGSEPWDDSALINAFDHAMATYKEMHSISNHGKAEKEGEQTVDSTENNLRLAGDTAGYVDPGSNSNGFSDGTTETGLHYQETHENLSGQGNTLETNVQAPESEPHSSCFPCGDGTTHTYSYQQNTEYEQLMKQYYDLEEQKQKIAQQLYQANYWNCQPTAESSTFQLPQVSGCSASEHCLQTPCLGTCHWLAVPLNPSSGCALDGLSSGSYSYPSHTECSAVSQSHQVPVGNHPATGKCCSTTIAGDMVMGNHSTAVDSAIKEGMLAAERAIKSMKMEASHSSNENKEMRMNVSPPTCDGKESESFSTETDLTAVLNAWYLAGFHTGRYLSEQSRKTNHQ